MNNISKSNEDDFDFSSIISSIKRRKRSFSLIFISIFLLSGLYAVKKRPIWEGTFQIVLKQNEKIDSVSSLLSTRSPISLLRNQASQNKLNTEIIILQSPSVLKPIYDYVKSEYDLLGYDTSKLRFRKWKKNLLVKLEKKSNVLNISYLDSEQNLIIPVLNKISAKYQEYSGRDRLKSLENAKDYLNNQVLIYKDKASESSRALQEYSILHNIGILDTGIKSSIRRKNDKSISASTSNTGAVMLDLENKYIGAKNKVNLINEKIKKVENIDETASLNQKVATLNALIDIDQAMEITKIIRELDAEIVRYKSLFNNKYPKVNNLELTKKETYKQLKDIVRGTLEAQKKEALALQNASKRPQEVIAKYKDLFRQYKLDLETLGNLELERKFNELSLAKKRDPWELISNPLLFDKPVSPNRPRIIFIGLFLGLVFGTLFVRFKDGNSEEIYDKKVLEKLLPYKILFDLSTFEDQNLEEIINFSIKQNFSKENLTILTLGDFISDLSEKALGFLKANKNVLKITNDFKEVEEATKILILISFSKLTKKNILYINKLLNLKKDSEIWIAYV